MKEGSPEEGDVQQKSWPQSHPAWAALNPRRAERASSCERGDAAAKNFQPLTQLELEHLAQSTLSAAPLQGTAIAPARQTLQLAFRRKYLSSSTYAEKLARNYLQ